MIDPKSALRTDDQRPFRGSENNVCIIGTHVSLGDTFGCWQILPLALPLDKKRCVAKSSCGEIFTLYSSETLNKEKSSFLRSIKVQIGGGFFFNLFSPGGADWEGGGMKEKNKAQREMEESISNQLTVLVLFSWGVGVGAIETEKTRAIKNTMPIFFKAFIALAVKTGFKCIPQMPGKISEAISGSEQNY